MSRSRLLTNRPLVAILAGAVVIIGLVVVSGYRTQRLVDRGHVVDELAHDVIYGAATSHLWLEEYLAGDGDPVLRDDAHEDLAAARQACTVLRLGGRVAGEPVEPLADDAQPAVTGLCDRLESLRELTDIRIANPAAHGAGSNLDRDYDKLFNETLAVTQDVHEAALEEVERQGAALTRMLGGLVALVAAAFALMAATVSRHARQLALSGRRQIASESLLREAQRISHVGHWQWDLSSDHAEWLAEEMYAIHGLTAEEWKGTSEAYVELIPPEDRQLFHDWMEEVVANGTATVVHRIVRPDGTVRHVRNRTEMVYSDNGEALCVVGTCQDVTDQEELRCALQKRVKELTCLTAVRRAVHELDDATDVCVATADALAQAMHHAHLAVATVDLDGQQHCTSGELSEGGEQLTAPILVDGTERGQVRVGYTCAAATFLPAEHDLVQSVATKLALWLERHESQAALAESEARFRRLVDNIPDVVFRYRLGDEEGFDYLSPSVEALTGYSPQEFLADPQLVNRILDPHVPGTGDASAPRGTPAAETPLGSATHQLVARDGSVRSFERNIAAVYDEHGELVALEGVARDVTERTAAERALEQRAREQTALARIGEAALTADGLADLFDLAVTVITETLPVEAAGVSELRPAAGELLVSMGVGWPEGVVGHTRMPIDTGSLAAAALAQDAPVVVADLSQDGAMAAPFLAEHGMVSGMSVVIGGRDAPFGALGAFSRCPQEYPDDQVRFLQTVADILGAAIERTAAESALTRSEREFRTLAEHLPDIIARYDKDHRYLYVNQPIAAVLGMPPSQIIGRTNSELGVSAAYAQLWEEANERVFANGEATTIEADHPGVDGTIHLQSLLIPEFDSQGGVSTVLAVSRDITELRRAEEHRRQGLARIVAAQEAERARIGEDIHDDSIQVMTAVGMRLEMLKYQTSDPEALQQLGRLEETVRHSIDRLRALMFELLPPELDRDGLPATLRLYLDTTATDGLPLWELVDNCTHELPTEMRVVLYRIAVEAIVNVRKHAHASQLKVVLDEVDDGVRLQVRDDGQGFDSDGLTDVGPHHVGTATMRGRAAAAGGTVDIHSVPGEGTVVFAWVPCASDTRVAS